MSEYWFFKDDCNKLYIKMEEHVPVGSVEGAVLGNKDMEMVDEEKENKPNGMVEGEKLPLADNQNVEEKVKTEVRYSWYYYDQEEQVDKLLEVLNIKGMREKRLIESLRKVKERLKLKKTKKPKVEETKEK